VLDVVAPGVMIGQIIGRWGNFVNMEAHGVKTSLPWRMGLSADGSTWAYYHPTFLYESLWNLVGFILIAAFYKKKKFNGQVFLFYMTWYGFGRMFIEGLRTDSLYLHIFGLDIRISQIVGFVTFIDGLVLMIVNLVKVKKYHTNTPAPAYIGASEEAGYGLSSAESDDQAGDESTVEAEGKSEDKTDG
jgi:phosphatidylglycerol:prolipoprotein diacylglycerol transferase